jgi:ABC-type transport system substrate-binding protein
MSLLRTARVLLAASALALAAPWAQADKVLRYAFPVATTSFDPAYVSDLYSRTVIAGMFDALLEYEFMTSPARMRPNTAAAMPEINADFTQFTFRIKPGIYFADDPAFKGVKRELTAQDYVYSLKRFYDPRWKSANLYLLEAAKILGLSELRQEVIAAKKPFDYDREVEGLKALDRYTLQIKLGAPSPRLLIQLADPSFTAAVAREVVEADGDKVGEHPVGTGPFVLKEWRRSSRIVLARNPNYRQVLHDEKPAADNARLVREAQALHGKRLPLVDEVHIAITEETQPRWLSFLNEELDLIEAVPNEFANVAFPNNVLAPNLAKRGLTMVRYPRGDITYTYFQMEHPVVGGYEPHKVALRRAIALATDVDREIRLVRRNQAVPAQSSISPGQWGHDPGFKSEMSTFDPARAKALLDLHGYVDKNGDGFREQPDGQPLVLEYATQPDQLSRQLAELWQKNMNAVGLKIEFKTAKWPENLKASRSGKLMMWGVGWLAGNPDGDTFLAIGYGPNKGQSNHARFDLPAFNRLYEQQRVLPDGPERQALMTQASRLLVAYMPFKVSTHRVSTDLAHPWVLGYHRNTNVRDFFKYVDIDVQRQRGRAAEAP